MASALMEKFEELVEKELINEGVFKELADLLKAAKRPLDDFIDVFDDIRAMAPLLSAAVGDEFVHHTEDGERLGGYWIERDTFRFLGRALGDTQVPKGWFLFRLVSTQSRGICSDGYNTFTGCNGGVLDAIEAWPLSLFRNYRADGTFDDRELALPPDKCWGFRTAHTASNAVGEADDEGEEDEDGEEEEEEEEEEGE